MKFILIFCSEVEQSLAGLIADRATDEVVEALTRYRRGMGIPDSPSIHFEDAETPDVVRSRSSQDPMGFVKIRDLDLPRHEIDSPTVNIKQKEFFFSTNSTFFRLFILSSTFLFI